MISINLFLPTWLSILMVITAVTSRVDAAVMYRQSSDRPGSQLRESFTNPLVNYHHGMNEKIRHDRAADVNDADMVTRSCGNRLIGRDRRFRFNFQFGRPNDLILKAVACLLGMLIIFVMFSGVYFCYCRRVPRATSRQHCGHCIANRREQDKKEDKGKEKKANKSSRGYSQYEKIKKSLFKTDKFEI